MTALIDRTARRRADTGDETMSFDSWSRLFSASNLQSMLVTTMSPEREVVDPSYTGFVNGLFLRNPIVFACLAIKARLFSEARFQFQQLRGGRPGNLFGTSDLAIIETPGRGRTTGDLLTEAVFDADLAGNAFHVLRPNAIRRLRPDWTIIAYGSGSRDLPSWDPDADVIGYGFEPGGPNAGDPMRIYGPDEVAHFAPTRHPVMRNLGVSPLNSLLREIMADNSATSHKLAFFENAATANLAVKIPASMDKTKAEEWIDLFEDAHRGALNAYRAIYFAGGLEPTPVGANMQQMTFTELQGKVETRVASALGIHPVVAALSEGLQGSSLNSGNFASAARLVGDATLRPAWRNFAGSLGSIIRPLASTRLWYDDRDIPFLRGDVKAQAEIMQALTQAVRTLTDGGWDPDAAVDAITSGDLRTLLGNHSGLLSVQMQAPGTAPADTGAGPSAMAATAWRVRGRDAAGDPVARERIRDAVAEIAGGSALYRCTREFVAWDGPEDAGGRVSLGELEGMTIRKGVEIPAWNPMVKAFPALFEPVAAAQVAQFVPAGPPQIVTRAEVLATRDRLRAGGRPHGHDAIAAELQISTATVRRRLTARVSTQPEQVSTPT